MRNDTNSSIWLISHGIGDLFKKSGHLNRLFCGDSCFLQGVAHELQPSVSLFGADGEREVSGAQSRMAPFLKVGG